MRTLTNRRGILIGIGVVATLGIAACAATEPPNSASERNGQTVPPAASPIHAAAPPAGTPSPTHAASPPAGTPSAHPTAPGGARNLVISSAGKSELTAAFLAFKGIPLSDLWAGGPVPGSVYFAYDPATSTYWALAQYEPSLTAPFDVKVNFQDGAGTGMFSKTAAGLWQVQLAGAPSYCGYDRFFPQAVLVVWSMPTSPPPGNGVCG